MTMIGFDPTKPVYQAARASIDMRNNLNSLFDGDIGCLRPRAQASQGMTISIAGTLVEGFWLQAWQGVTVPLNYAGGNSPTVTAPSSHPRIDLLTIDSTGTLSWTPGAEATSPTAPNCPTTKIPICYIYCVVGMTKIYNFEDHTSHTGDGYIYRDVRPFLTLPSALSIAGQTQGDVLYYDGSVWTRLAAGTSGLYLKTLGAGQTPIYDNPLQSAIGSIIVALDSEYTAGDTSYTVIKAIAVPFAGVYRVKFSMKSNGYSTAIGRIFGAGAAIGTQRTNATANYIEYSEDFTFVAGEIVDVRCYTGAGGEYNLKNFRIYSNIGQWAVLLDLVNGGTGLGYGNIPYISGA